jgi:hypothetical protein
MSIPATAKRVSGKTSVTCWPRAIDSRSSGEPGIAAGAAAKFSVSAMRNTAMMEIIRIEPCSNKPGPSIITEPIAAVVELEFRILHT